MDLSFTSLPFPTHKHSHQKTLHSRLVCGGELWRLHRFEKSVSSVCVTDTNYPLLGFTDIALAWNPRRYSLTSSVEGLRSDDMLNQGFSNTSRLA
jgi:phage gp46-like protein